MTYDDERAVAPSPTSVRSRVALGLAVAACITAVAIRTTVAGESALAQGAVTGDTTAILGSTLGFAAAAVLVIAAVIAALDPIITNRGRRLGVAAACLALGSPLIAAVVGFVVD
jgi:hypothetical protein